MIRCGLKHAFCGKALGLDCHLVSAAQRRGLLRSLARSKSSSFAPDFGQHDVAGFQIAVNNSVTVRFVQSVRNLDSIVDPVRQRRDTCGAAIRDRNEPQHRKNNQRERQWARDGQLFWHDILRPWARRLFRCSRRCDSSGSARVPLIHRRLY